jgi:hypothetical protein
MLFASIMAAVLLPVDAQASPKTVSVVFVNQASSRTLTVYTPAGQQVVGSFQFGGYLTVKVPLPENGGGVKVSWKAGRLFGEFTLTPDSPGNLRIDLRNSDYHGPYEGGPPPPPRPYL